MLKEKKTPARKEVGRGGHLYQQEPTNSFGVPMSRVTKIEGAVSREELDAALSELAGKDLPNLIEGVTAQVNANQRRKLESAKAGDKSMSNGFTRSEHQGVAARIANAWKWAAEAGRDGDKKNHMPDVGIRRYVSALNLNGDDAFAWITVKESSKGLRIYSVELMDNKKLRESVSSGAGKAATDALHRSFEEIILRLNTPVNEQKQALFQSAGRGAAYDSVDDDFMNRSQIQGIVRKEKMKSTRKNEGEGVRLNQAMSQSQADSLENFIEGARKGQIEFWKSDVVPSKLREIFNDRSLIINIPYDYIQHLDNRRPAESDELVANTEKIISEFDDLAEVVSSSDYPNKRFYRRQIRRRHRNSCRF